MARTSTPRRLHHLVAPFAGDRQGRNLLIGDLTQPGDEFPSLSKTTNPSGDRGEGIGNLTMTNQTRSAGAARILARRTRIAFAFRELGVTRDPTSAMPLRAFYAFAPTNSRPPTSLSRHCSHAGNFFHPVESVKDGPIARHK